MPAMPHEKRLEALRGLLAEKGLDALYIDNLTNILYLCGFVGSHGRLIVDKEDALFVTDGRYREVAGSIVKGARVELEPMSGSDAFFQGLFRRTGYGTIGFEGSMTVTAHEQLRKWLRPAKTKPKRADDLVTRLRLVKDSEEIKIIARAARTADRMMAAAWEAIRAGVPEREVSLSIRRAAEDLGAEGESFDNIVAGGANASRPHHRPGDRRLRKGDMVTVDLGAIVDGYCSDLTRNPVLGKASRKFERIYQVCLEAQTAAVKACRAGAKAKDVDALARDIIATHGFGDYFNHGLGHGVGLEIHEGPRLNKVSKAVLEPGMVVTVEPGIYLPGFGGVRIEDLIVVTDGAPRVLSRSPKALTVLPG